MKMQQNGLSVMIGPVTRLVAPWVVACVLGVSPAFGAHPLITDDAFTQGKGKSQVEASLQYDRDDDDGIRTDVATAKIQFSYGLLEPLDLIMEIPRLAVRQTQAGDTTNSDGIGDITLSMKWRLSGEKEGLQLALKPFVTVPTGDEERGLGFGREAYGITLISTWDREAWCVSVNLGYQHVEYGLQSDREAYRPDIWSASLSAQYRIVERVWLAGEAGLTSNPDKASDTPPAFINAGVIYGLTDSVDLDVGYRYGLNKPMPDATIAGAVTLRF